VTYQELKIKVSEIEPSLSEEGKLLLSIFLPAYEEQEALIKSQQATIEKQAKRIKELEDQLYILEYLTPLFWFHLTPLFLRFDPPIC